MRASLRRPFGIACALTFTGCDKVAVVIAEVMTPIVLALLVLVVVGTVVALATLIAGVTTLVRGYRQSPPVGSSAAATAGVLNSLLGLGVTTAAASALVEGRSADAAFPLLFGAIVLTIGVANIRLVLAPPTAAAPRRNFLAFSILASVGIAFLPALVVVTTFGRTLPGATALTLLLVGAVACGCAYVRARVRPQSVLSISPSLVPVVAVTWLFTFYCAGYLRARAACTTGLCANNNGCSVSAAGFGFTCRIPATSCSSTCINQGKCTLKDGACIAEAKSDCQHSLLCSSHGLCTPQNGVCVAEGGDCLASRDCIDLGRCKAENRACVLSDESCMRKDACRDEGKCKLVGTECTVTEEGCNASAMCKKDGLCSAWFGRCQAFSFRDCEKSEACTKHGRCKERSHVCVE